MHQKRAGAIIALVFCLPFYCSLAFAADAKPRARDLGVPFDGVPGPFNAITDVAGVEVGHTTLISGNGPLKVGVGPVRTGVTAILPRGKANLNDPGFCGMVQPERQWRDDWNNVGLCRMTACGKC